MDVEATELTHDEIWDDSALVDSWNEALEEYKKYHSIFANKGAKWEDVPAPEKTRGDAKLETEKPDAAAASARDRETLAPAASQENQGGGAGESLAGSAARGPPAPPMAVLGTSLKSLLMAWYYAGYYTGLHEGRQQQQQPGEDGSS